MQNDAKKLGFESYDEMMLYKDVCASRTIKLEKTFNDNLREKKFIEPTKEGYNYFIKNNGLLDLFNKVKDMSLFNRFVEIYIYNANGLSICKMMQDMYIKEIEEAKEEFDGEKEVEFTNKLKKVLSLKSECFESMLYIESELIERLPEKKKKFYKTVEEVDNKLFNINDGGNQKKL